MQALTSETSDQAHSLGLAGKGSLRCWGTARCEGRSQHHLGRGLMFVAPVVHMSFCIRFFVRFVFKAGCELWNLRKQGQASIQCRTRACSSVGRGRSGRANGVSLRRGVGVIAAGLRAGRGLATRRPRDISLTPGKGPRHISRSLPRLPRFIPGTLHNRQRAWGRVGKQGRAEDGKRKGDGEGGGGVY